MRVDLSAVPRLINSPPVAGAGDHRSEAEWSEVIAALRSRFMVLSYGELCDLLRQMEFGDLIGLIISPPFGDDLLHKFQEGLSTPVGAMLADDCAKHGENRLSADLACGTHARSDAALCAIETKRATHDQRNQLRPLALQLAEFSGEDWYREARLPTEALYPLISITGGLDGAFGQRIKALSSPSTWAFLQEDYPDQSDEPLPRKIAEQALSDLPALLAGQPWPFDSNDGYLDDDEMDAWENEMDQQLNPSAKKGDEQ
jgi:hypothetical protein